MKKIVNMLIITLMALMTGFNSVEAASYPSNISVSSIGKLNYGGGIYFPVKYLSDGKLGYCTELYDNFPMGVAMSNPKKVNAGLTYIIDNGFKGTKADVNNSTKMRQYYVTQAAIYTYLGQANPSKSTTIGKEIWSVVDKAKQASEQTAKLSVTLNVTSTTMKLTSDKKYFISEAIAVKSNYSNVTFNTAVSSGVGASLVDANGKAITSVKSGSVVYIKVPESIIKAGQSVTLSMAVKGARTIKNAYIYQPGDSSYQNIIPGIVYPSQEAAEAKLSVKASKDKITTKVKISKQDITNKKELPGASLAIKDMNGKVIASWTSGTTPKMISGLKAGNYTLCETAAPAGYVLKTECIKFTVKADGSVTSVVMYNEPKKVEIKKPVVSITKIDAETKKSLAGATLVLKNTKNEVIKTFTTTTKATVFTDIAAGTYTLEETKAPAGYNLSTKKVTVTLKNGQTTNVTFENTKKPVVPVKVTKVKISKQDITNNKELPGASLVIKDSKGNIVKSWVSTNEPAYFEGLNAGDYTLCETAAPAGYVLKTECIKFTVKADNTVKTVVMYNEPKKEEIVTKVQISKQDITTKKELPGASLVIKDANGKEIEKWVSTDKPKYIEGLKAGNYTLCETTAPAGYVLATECVNFTVKADGTITKVVIYNERKKEEIKRDKVKISKQDIATKSELPGATLVIKDATGKEIKRWVSTNEAFYFELEAGVYTLEEIIAPAGYILSTEKIEFTVNEDGSCDTEVIMFNTREVKVPITASNASILLYFTGFIGLFAGFIKINKNARI